MRTMYLFLVTAVNRSVALGTLVLCVSGCATIVHGRSQTVLISSEPSGAAVTVDGAARGTTPAVTSLRRNVPHTIGVAVDGYAPETRLLSPSASYGLVALNLFLIHPAVAAVGVGIDMLTGAHNNLSPRDVHFRPAVRDTSADERSVRVELPWPPAPIGSRLRVSTVDHSVGAAVGTLQAVAGDTLLLKSAVPGVYHYIPRQSIGTIELSLGPDRIKGSARGMLRGALGGLAAGALVGGIMGGLEGGSVDVLASAYFLSLLYGLPSGLVIGGIVGYSKPAHDKWLKIR